MATVDELVFWLQLAILLLSVDSAAVLMLWWQGRKLARFMRAAGLNDRVKRVPSGSKWRREGWE
jgi:hypothetical protein